MKSFLDIITEAMTVADASNFFKQHGVDISHMDAAALKSAQRGLAKKLHPDVGGDVEAMKKLNDAYATLVHGNTGTGAGKAQSQAARAKNLKEPPMCHHTGTPNRDFYDIRHVEAYFKNKAGQAATPDKNAWRWGKKDAPVSKGHAIKNYTVWNFDGRFFRGVFTVPGTPDDWNEMADAMEVWDRFNTTVATFVSAPDGSPYLHLVKFMGHYFGSRGETIQYDSINQNPGNDNQMADRVKKVLDRLSPGWDNR